MTCGRTTGSSPRRSFVAGAGLALVAAAGCSSTVGPVHLRLETGGVRYEGFVVRPSQEYARLHSSDIVTMDPLIVASEEDITLPKFSAGPSFMSLRVSVYHPEFVYEWTGEAKSSTGEMTLPPVRLQRWAEYIEEHEAVSMRVVEAHLDRLSVSFVPVFEAGETRRQLRKYLPDLQGLVESASWLPGDSGSWANADDARIALLGNLQTLSELMQ